MLTDEQILDQNPWWRQTRWRGQDPHLRRLDAMPMLLPAPLVPAIDLATPGIHILRGPRQVGKSTTLKLLVERALSEKRNACVIFLALDLLEGQAVSEIARLVQRARQLAPAVGRGPDLILLDEVTVAAHWQTAVKSLWDDGTIDGAVLVCTGSSAVDLASGAADRLPGRRGSGSDHLMLPADFGSFACAQDGGIPSPPGCTIADLCGGGFEKILLEMQVHLPALSRQFERYLVFGGLPAAVAEAVSGITAPSSATLRVIEDGLLRETLRKGASETATWALFERVLRSLGSRVSWEQMAREMDVPLGSKRRPSKRSGPAANTLRDYLEFCGTAYLVLILYAWRTGADSNAIARQKKLYGFDPLVMGATTRHVPGLRPDLPAQVENAVAIGLYRRYESRAKRLSGFQDPDDLHYWVTRAGGEVDFVCGPRHDLQVCEVKYRSRIDLRTVARIPATFPGRPICVATRDRLERREDLILVPAGLLLWALSAGEA